MANNAIIAKSKAVAGKLLTPDDYQNLLHKNSIAAAIAYLKTKPFYAAVFSDSDEAVMHRERAEALINKSVFDNYLRICKFAASDMDGFTSFYIKQLEAEQLSKAVISVCRKSQESFVTAFPQYIRGHICFDPYRLAESDSFTSLAAAIKGTMYYKPLLPLLLSESPDINALVTTVNCCYIKWAFDKIDSMPGGKKHAKRLKSFFLRKADADNLLICYRLRDNFGFSAQEISEFLIPYRQRLHPEDIDEALRANDPITAIKALFISKKLACWEDMAGAECPELAVGAADFRYFRHELAMCTGDIQALYSLVMLLKAESTNVCRVIEGIRYGLSPDKTEKYLVF